MIGDSNSPDLQVRLQEEVTVQNILARVKKFVVSDDASYSVEWLVKEYERQIKEIAEKHAKEDLQGQKGARGRRIPMHDSSTPFEVGRDALRSVAQGPANWLFWKAAEPPQCMQVMGGGLGDVAEMAQFLSEHTDMVLFGLIRMVFGVGRLRRTKHVFVHAIGKMVPAVERGKLAQKRPKMRALVNEFAQISVEMEVEDETMLTDEEVVERVRKAAIIDDENVGGDEAGKSVFTVEHFREAVREEGRLADEEQVQAKGERRRRKWMDLPVEELVRLVHHDGTPNWALFVPGKAWLTGIEPPSVVFLTGKLKPHKGAQPLGGFAGAAQRRSQVAMQAPTPMAPMTDGDQEKMLKAELERVERAAAERHVKEEEERKARKERFDAARKTAQEAGRGPTTKEEEERKRLDEMPLYRWQPVKLGDPVPEDAIEAGETLTDGAVYVARSDATELGKMNLDKGNAYHIWCHGSGKQTQGEVLVVPKEWDIEWKTIKKGDPLPEGVVCGGSTRTDGNIFVARVQSFYGLECGKLNVKDGLHGEAHKIWVHSSRWSYTEGEVLCIHRR